MDSQADQSTNTSRPMARQPVDSYHRHIRAVHGVDGNSSEPGPSSAMGKSDSRRHGSGVGSQPGNIATFFDSERLATSTAPWDPSNDPSPATSRAIRWPFLGSIRSRVSQSFPSSPRVLSPSEPIQIDLPWRPVFLHRRILCLYAIVFVILIAGVQVALQLSEHNGGLRESDDLSRYLWQYGTTLVFITVATFWNRVEFQASAAMPWIRMLNNQVEVDKSLLLDYVSLSEPVAIVKAIRNTDWLVATPLSAGIIFKLIVIFSTAFVTPKVTTVARHKSAITIESDFSNSLSGLENIGSLPYFTLAALAIDNITFPNGVTSRAAYTPFASDIVELKEITADVEGFIGGLDCDEAKLTLDSMRLDDRGSLDLNLTISDSNCSVKQALVSTKLASTKDDDLSRVFLAFQPGSCGGSTKDDQQRIAVMAGVLEIDVNQLKRQSKNSNSRLGGKIPVSSAFLCRPNYAITTIKVSKTPDTVLSAIPSKQATNTTLDQVSPWDIARALFVTLESDEAAELQLLSTSSGAPYNDESIVDADEAMSAALALSSKGGNQPKLESLTDGDALKQLAQDFFAQYSALIARYAMMEPSSSSSTAVTSFIERRLVVRPVPAYLITAFLAICFVLALVTICLAPKKGFLPRDPSTIVGMASVVAHSHPLVECLKGMGPAPNRAIRSRLGDSTYMSGAEGHEKLENPNLGYYHIFGGNAPPPNVLPRRFDSSTWRQPVSLHGLIRLIYVLVLACIVIGFEISLRVSHRFDGLRTMDTDTAYLAWTLVPALVLLLVAMYMLSLEWWTRLLSPFSHLARKGDFDETVGLNLANALRHVAWRRAFKIRDIAALAAISGASFALLMVVASAPLFEPMPAGRNTSIPLRTEDFFANSLASSTDDPICVDCNNDTISASLILAGNAPYPPFTYANLNLPSISLVEEDNSKDLKIGARVTAIRPNMLCRLYKPDEISTNVTVEYELDDGTVNPLRVDLEGETCRGDGERDSSNAIIGTTMSSFSTKNGRGTSSSSSTVFGVGLRKTKSSPRCSDWIYIWGSLADLGSSDTSVSSINALACNESIEAVEVDAIFRGSELHIHPDHPPVAFESTAQDTTVAIPELDYASLVNISSDGLLDSFFAMLNASQFAVSDATFGDSSPSAASEVQSAILSQHGIIRAQSLNSKSRRHLSSRGTFPSANDTDIVSGVSPNQSVSQAVPVISGSKMTETIRLRQDTIATRIFQGLVGALMILHIISWMYWRRLKLPRSPTTIASITALLVDGNLFKSLPRAAQWQPDSELETIYTEGDITPRFELGWDRKGRGRRRDGRAKKEEGNFGIRAIVPKDSIPEEVEMRPIPPPKSPPKPANERIGRVHQGTAALEADDIKRKSVMVTKGHTTNSKSKSSKSSKGSKGSQGSNEPKRKRSISSALSGPKELVKVWWAGG